MMVPLTNSRRKPFSESVRYSRRNISIADIPSTPSPEIPGETSEESAADAGCRNGGLRGFVKRSRSRRLADINWNQETHSAGWPWTRRTVHRSEIKYLKRTTRPSRMPC